MKYDKNKYIEKKVKLFPGDTYSKYGIIKNVDDLGWIIEITESQDSSFKKAEQYFISHSMGLEFEFCQ